MLDQPQSPSASDDFNRREMELLRQMLASGVVIAVPAALHYCHEYKCQAPDWLLAASLELICELLKSEKPKRRGRASSHIARYRQDRIDYDRWGTVVWMRDAQKDLAHQVEVARSVPNVPRAYLKDREKLHAWLGSTLDRAFQCATIILEGNESFASPDAIKRSYFKVERNMADPTKAMRYYQLYVEFLPKVGLKWEPFVRPGRKLEPLYNLEI
jgi:hypothetical protein